MAEPEAMQPMADRGAVHLDTVNPLKLQTQLVQGQIAPRRQACADPGAQTSQLAVPTQIALRFRRKRTRFTAQFDHVIDEFRRNPEMTRRFPVAVPFVDKANNTLSQLYRMWFTHP